MCSIWDVENNKFSVKDQFATQLKAYRNKLGISQEDLAEAVDKQQPYIANVENSDIGIGIENMAEISACFGVKYYELANPLFPIPSKAELQKNMTDYLVSKGVDPNYMASKSAPGFTRRVDDFLEIMPDVFQSSTEIASRINKMFLELVPHYEKQITPSKVADILNHAPRNKKVEIIKSGRRKLYKPVRKDPPVS